ncbi:S41 family peptidase [Catalinimonas niigatensis]|uniref:S41 family peptidase n=1 Tax=Catalinimonas niigatensis TaxID=1397264 RepID=UPI0026669520|nr:S41 family peptidase [Catalinimonas niigatensis]WPP48129.1 S41 family peptidase [Catalinimonas niigatensis]
MKAFSLSILSVILISFFCSSCEEVLINEEHEDNAVDVFNSLWTTVDENYTFFDYKNIDWDEVYAANRPRVENGMRRDSLFNVLADMLFELRDGHVNLQAGFDLSRNWQWYLDYPQNFDYSIIERNYLKDDYEISGPFRNRIIDSIGYVYYPSFESDVSESLVDYIIGKYSSRVVNNRDTIIVKGLVIDVRNNGGGKISNVEKIVGRFADEKKKVHYWQYKNGPEHNNFTERIPKYVEPEGEYQYQAPVVILTNRSCYSATNFFVQIMKNFPNVLVIGDSTGGGGGLPVNRELPNGWRYRFSSTVTTTVSGENIEDGVAPDIKVDMREEDMQEGRDTILERAFEIINSL